MLEITVFTVARFVSESTNWSSLSEYGMCYHVMSPTATDPPITPSPTVKRSRSPEFQPHPTVTPNSHTCPNTPPPTRSFNHAPWPHPPLIEITFLVRYLNTDFSHTHRSLMNSSPLFLRLPCSLFLCGLSFLGLSLLYQLGYLITNYDFGLRLCLLSCVSPVGILFIFRVSTLVTLRRLHRSKKNCYHQKTQHTISC